MDRISIELPARYNFCTTLNIRVDDLNYANHLSNEMLLVYAHEARVQFLNQFNYKEPDIEGVGIILNESAVVYKAEGFWGDSLKIEVAVKNVTKIGFTLIYLISNTETKQEVARVRTGIVFFDYDKRKVAMIPEKAKEVFKDLD